MNTIKQDVLSAISSRWITNAARVHADVVDATGTKMTRFELDYTVAQLIKDGLVAVCGLATVEVNGDVERGDCLALTKAGKAAI